MLGANETAQFSVLPRTDFEPRSSSLLAARGKVVCVENVQDSNMIHGCHFDDRFSSNEITTPPILAKTKRMSIYIQYTQNAGIWAKQPTAVVLQTRRG